MIYVFRRLGFLVPLVVIFSALFLAILRDEGGVYTGEHLLRDIFYLSSSILLPLGLKLNLKLKEGEPSHTFYWLKIEYWSIITLGLGVLFHLV